MGDWVSSHLSWGLQVSNRSNCLWFSEERHLCIAGRTTIRCWRRTWADGHHAEQFLRSLCEGTIPAKDQDSNVTWFEGWRFGYPSCEIGESLVFGTQMPPLPYSPYSFLCEESSAVSPGAYQRDTGSCRWSNITLYLVNEELSCFFPL